MLDVPSTLIHMMKPTTATTPEQYVAEIGGWRREIVDLLRAATRSCRGVEEVLKWGHLVYLTPSGPALLIRAEDNRVLFGFWRGQRLMELEPRLKPGGKYEMATIDLREGDKISATAAKRLVRAAMELNEKLGNPQDAAKTKTVKKAVRKTSRRVSKKQR